MPARGSNALASRVAAVCFAAAAALWVGCGTDNGDPAGSESEDVPASAAGTGTSRSDDTPPRPAFDATFDDDGGGTTPDGGAGEPCLDPDDPGSSENVAKALPDTDDCDNNLKPVNGVANGAVDVDFFKLSGADKSGCSIAASFELLSQGAEMCVFLQCKKGATNFDKCTNGTEVTSPLGVKGCCTTGPGKAIPAWSCGGLTQFDDSADMVFRVRQLDGGNACLPYSFSYRF